jgi:hypothetical protein
VARRQVDQLGTPANKKNVEADEDGVGPLDIIPPLVAQRFCAMARTCRSRMSATWPLSGVIRTLSPQRPRAEFDPERTWASARRSAAPRAPVCAPGRQRTPHPPRTRISVPGAPQTSPKKIEPNGPEISGDRFVSSGPTPPARHPVSRGHSTT